MDTDNLLDSLDARARRQLDGMTINRDSFSRDVLRLTQAVREEIRRAAGPINTMPPEKQSTNFREIFADIFKQTGGTP